MKELKALTTYGRRLAAVLALAVLALWPPAGHGAAAPLKVVATTEDLASLAREIGGDRIAVDVFSRGYQDPHFVEPKPSFILKLVNADLLIVVGRELEIGWLPPLLTQSRNSKIQPGAQRVSRRVAERPDPRHSNRTDHSSDGRRPPARQSALLAGSRERPTHRAVDPRSADRAAAER